MTGKRFEYKNHKVYDNLTGETHSSNMVSVNVLNELYEENQDLSIKKEDAEYELLHLKEKYEELLDENEQLKSDNKWLLICVKNQSVIINELDSTIMAYNMEHKITIKLTEKDLKTLDKALSYYTHQKVEE